jgi:hypothetical protein
MNNLDKACGEQFLKLKREANITECRSCGSHTNCVEGLCSDCFEVGVWLDNYLKENALNYFPLKADMRDLIVFLLQKFEDR